MKNSDISKYCGVMEEIKRRIKVIDSFSSGSRHNLYEATTVEAAGLQLRKVLELIAMATLIANREEYAKVYANFAKSWNAEYLLKDLERINTNFYPEPIIESPSDQVGVKTNLDTRTDDWLSKDEFVMIYKKCGGLLHASNPLGREIDYDYYKQHLPLWRNKVLKLLNVHTIRLLNQTGFYLIHMRDEKDNNVRCYTFNLYEDKLNPKSEY